MKTNIELYLNNEYINVPNINNIKVNMGNNYLVANDINKENYRVIKKNTISNFVSFIICGISIKKDIQNFLRLKFWNKELVDIRMIFSNDFVLQGSFYINNYEITQNRVEEEEFSIKFESSGMIKV